MTKDQAIELTEWLTVFEGSDPLYTIDIESSILDPYIYEDKVCEFIRQCYANGFVVYDYLDITDDFLQNRDNQDWYDQLTEHQALQVIAWHIRGDRISSGCLAGGLKDEIPRALRRIKQIHNI